MVITGEMREQPRVRVSRSVNYDNIFVSVILLAVVLVMGISSVVLFNFSLIETFILVSAIIIVYSIAVIILSEPNKSVKVSEVRNHYTTIESPVVREVVVEKPVVHEVIREVETPVYIEKPRQKLNIPHYDYVASTETRTYHLSSCRLGKLIKRKYKLSDDNPGFFKSKGFKGCKVCIRKLKKI